MVDERAGVMIELGDDLRLGERGRVPVQSRSSVSVRTTSVNISEVYEAVPYRAATTKKGWPDARFFPAIAHVAVTVT